MSISFVPFLILAPIFLKLSFAGYPEGVYQETEPLGPAMALNRVSMVVEPSRVAFLRGSIPDTPQETKTKTPKRIAGILILSPPCLL
jgi:hypothetical protein